MTDPGPFGEGDPFGGVPFLGDLARMIQGQGPVAWDAARQLAVSIATDGAPEPNVDPLDRMRLEQLGRVADLHVAEATGLSSSVTGRVVQVVPATRTQWVMRTVDDYRPLFERLAGALGDAPIGPGDAGPSTPEGGPGEGQGRSTHPAMGSQPGGIEPSDPEEAAAEWLGGLMKMLSPMLLGMTAGSMIGHLGKRCFGQYDIPIPRPPSDELIVVPTTLKAFAEEWSLPVDDLFLWVCVHELIHHAVLGVPHVRARLESMLARWASGFSTDPSALEEKLGNLDPSQMEGVAGFQRLLSDPEVLLGAVRSPEQHELAPFLEALVLTIVGYVDHVMDRIGGTLIASYSQVTEAMRRNRVASSDADRFVERLFGLELTQQRYDRGSAFIEGVVERAGESALGRLWADEQHLPTPAELDAPGLWLARIDLPA